MNKIIIQCNYIAIYPKDNVVWSDGTYSPVICPWTITKASLTKPSLKDPANYQWSGGGVADVKILLYL